jgi:CheY-like chemotaxis protein
MRNAPAPPSPCGRQQQLGPAPPIVLPDSIAACCPLARRVAAFVQDFDRKDYDREVAMKAATYNKHCYDSGADARTPSRARLHTPRRRNSLAHSLREALADTQAHERQFGKRIRSIETMPLAAVAQAVGVRHGVPRVLLVDSDSSTAMVLTSLLVPEAQVVHVTTLAQAQRALANEIFSAVVIDPNLPDGDAGMLLPALAATPLLVYAAHQPAWRGEPLGAYLPKPWTSPRQLWTTISGMLGIAGSLSAGD